MKLVFLDRKSIGDDIDFSPFYQLGDVDEYNFSTPEEVPDRIQDADVIIVNKIPVNKQTIGHAAKLKLVCVTATGTNNLDKTYLEQRGIAWRNVAGYSTESVAQHTFAMLFYLLEHLRYYDEYVAQGHYLNDTMFTQAFSSNQRNDLGNHWLGSHRTQSRRNRPAVWSKHHLLLRFRSCPARRLSPSRC